MKKMLLLLVALVAFAACDDDPIDYSTWSNEELLATPGGVDYLIRTAAPIDYAAIEEELETKVFDPYYFFVYSSRDGWLDSQDKWDGGVDLNPFVVLDDVVRYCFREDVDDYRTSEGERVEYMYFEYPYTGDRLAAVLKYRGHERANLKARIENTLIVESYDEYGRRWLDLVRLTDNREEYLNTYRHNFYDLILYLGGTPYHEVLPN